MASFTRRAKADPGTPAVESRILAATERLIERGERYTEISVQQILTEAGVSRATFYAHFRDKTDLIVRLTADLRQRLLEMAQGWDPAAGEDGADRYTRFFADVIALHRRKGFVLAALREVASYDQTVRGFYTADLEGFDQAVLRTLVEQQQSGKTPADLDAAAASRVIVWGGGQAIARHIEVDNGDGDAAFARELGHIWWYGAYRRPPANNLIEEPKK
ncbi:AcrR family transcriptional regulator [Micromonospora vinacea]|uniref:AcrR family transcriptional regulator n=1 Tax=Micromonospora vinacea TaxID=709878 RepID=A0ABS0KBJ7_9ACTN|nr:TetR/AcrR family transcriptional regulator [Micromonospora vinacea]MBG6106012.1 AcrR family transcriptional regulator [Micromonospora vinacea]WTA65724.1 TetR/AcrR family transcriptional regulator [Micromonospora sp. NBC_00855]